MRRKAQGAEYAKMRKKQTVNISSEYKISTLPVIKVSTEGSCLMQLLGPGKSRISQKLHYSNSEVMNALTK